MWNGKEGGVRGLTFELTGQQRQAARPGAVKMYTVPPTQAWWPAVGAPVERGVRHHLAVLICVDSLWSMLTRLNVQRKRSRRSSSALENLLSIWLPLQSQ
jgi:hypothetical protein